MFFATHFFPSRGRVSFVTCRAWIRQLYNLLRPVTSRGRWRISSGLVPKKSREKGRPTKKSGRPLLLQSARASGGYWPPTALLHRELTRCSSRNKATIGRSPSSSEATTKTNETEKVHRHQRHLRSSIRDWSRGSGLIRRQLRCRYQVDHQRAARRYEGSSSDQICPLFFTFSSQVAQKHRHYGDRLIRLHLSKSASCFE